jgi:hypothetical protein
MIHLKPTADEKLGYWSKRMDSYLYKFLLLNHLNAGKLDYVEALDSRTWFNLAHTLAKARHARIATNTLVKLLSAHAGKEIGASFADYAVHGEDPEKYPIGHKEFLTADGDKLKDLLGRIGRWASSNQTPLIGATQWDLSSWIKDQIPGKDTGQAPNAISQERAAKNIAKFMIDIGTAGYADLARSMVDSLRKTPFLRAVLSEIKGTPLEKKFISVFERFEADKAEAKEPQKEEAAVA